MDVGGLEELVEKLRGIIRELNLIVPGQTIVIRSRMFGFIGDFKDSFVLMHLNALNIPTLEDHFFEYINIVVGYEDKIVIGIGDEKVRSILINLAEDESIRAIGVSSQRYLRWLIRTIQCDRKLDKYCESLANKIFSPKEEKFFFAHRLLPKTEKDRYLATLLIEYKEKKSKETLLNLIMYSFLRVLEAAINGLYSTFRELLEEKLGNIEE